TAERRHLYDAGSHRKRILRQHPSLHRAARPLFHDGRQPRQLDRQPRTERRRLRALRKYYRQGADHLLLDPRRRARLGGVALALEGTLEPSLHSGAMTRRGKANPVVASQEPPVAEAAPPAVSAAALDGQKEPRRRRRRGGDGSLEERISYRFKDPMLL